MRKPTVRLYLRIRRPNGRTFFAEPARNKNCSVRPGYAVVDGRLEHHPDGVYYLRYAKEAKRIWESIGKDATAALVARMNREHDLQALILGRVAGDPTPQVDTTDQPDMNVQQAVDAYVAEVRDSRAPKTITACESMLGEFSQRYRVREISSINRADLLGHMRHLRARGLSDRTVFNHVARINTLLRLHGVTQILRPSDWPSYDQKVVSAYGPEEVEQLLKVASDEERLLFTFFLLTGFREQEVMHCTWSDVDFRDRIITVRSKPEFGFRPKIRKSGACQSRMTSSRRSQNAGAPADHALCFQAVKGTRTVTSCANFSASHSVLVLTAASASLAEVLDAPTSRSAGGGACMNSGEPSQPLTRRD